MHQVDYNNAAMKKKTLYTAFHPYQGHIIVQDYDLELVKHVAVAIAERTSADIDVYANEVRLDTDTEEMQFNAWEGQLVWGTSISFS
jgi:hypothetical protein